MGKQFFESKEEARKFLETVFCHVAKGDGNPWQESVNQTLEEVENNGFIKMSALEKTRSDYYKVANSPSNADQNLIKIKLLAYKDELEKAYYEIKAYHQKFD